MWKIALPSLAAIGLCACVGGRGSTDSVPVAVVEPPAPQEYALIGGAVGDALVDGRDALRGAQEILSGMGYDPGPADGLMGPRTRAALEQFQAAKSIPVSGGLTVDTQGALQFETNAAAANSAAASAQTQTASAAPVTPSTATRADPSVSSSRSSAGNWLGFISGEDIRASCRSGAPDTYRFIYNAKFSEHVRLYEMLDVGDGSALLDIIVRGATQAAADPTRLAGRLTGKRSVNGLAQFERNSLVETLVSSGFTSSPAPSGTLLPSDGHYWVVSGCRNGTFVLNAWTYPSDRWDSITFPGMLGQLDFTNVRFNPVSELTEAQRAAARSADGPARAFDIRVVDGGRLQLI